MKANAEKDNVGEELENELAAMERAIQDAADRIEKLWDNSKRSQTGVKLEVNGKVLDSCTSLMKSIIELINSLLIDAKNLASRTPPNSAIFYISINLLLQIYFIKLYFLLIMLSYIYF